MRKIELQHSPDKYPLLENYSGWELFDTVEINEREYVRSLPIYCTEDTEIWFIDFPMNVEDLPTTSVAHFHIQTNSAQNILAAVKLFQKEAQ